MENLLLVSGLFFAAIHVWSTIKIYAFLKERDDNIESFLMIRLNTFRYLKKYKEMTANENGRPGYLYSIWVYSINLALLCFVLFGLARFLPVA